MIRKLLLPALLAGLLGGCLSYGYGYHDGYYYGQPSIQFRYYDYGYPYSYGYGYYPYGGYYNYYGYHGYPYRYYGYPYRYGYGYGHPYQPYYPYRHPRPSGPRPPDHGDHDGDHDGNDNPPPWRDFDRRRRLSNVAGRALQDQGTIAPPPIRETPPHREVRGEGPRTDPATPRSSRTQETRRRQSGNDREP